MNHTTLLLGTVVIFLMAALGYTTIPDYLEQRAANTADSNQLQTDAALETAPNTVSETSGVAATPERTEKYWEDDDGEESEHEDDDDDHYSAPSSGTSVASDPVPPTQTAPATAPATSGYTLAEVALHADSSSCWTAVNGSVYDLTPFIRKHPGGVSNIMKICGIDGSAAFSAQHGGQSRPENTLTEFFIGPLI